MSVQQDIQQWAEETTVGNCVSTSGLVNNEMSLNVKLFFEFKSGGHDWTYHPTICNVPTDNLTSAVMYSKTTMTPLLVT